MRKKKSAVESLIALLKEFPVAISVAVIIGVFLLRFAVGGFDPSYFILAGEKFVVKEELSKDIIVLKSGYDGQFFYRYALNPFSKDIEYAYDDYGTFTGYGDFGIKVDHPKYRRGRIFYPLAAWFFAFGQQPLVPYTLILVNIFAFILLCYISTQLVKHFEAPQYYAYFPLFIGGLYFSVARDLADTVTCALLALSYYQFIKKKLGWFLLFSTMALLCREASAFFLLPAFAILFFQSIQADKFSAKLKHTLALFIPWIIYLIWNRFNASLYPDITESSFHHLPIIFGLPFKGMYDGFMNDPSVYWYIVPYKLSFILWTFALFALCFRSPL